MKHAKTIGLTLVAVFAVSVAVTGSASAVSFRCASYPCTVSAKIDAEFSFGTAGYNCPSGEYLSGEITGASESLILTPKYTCSVFGEPVAVSMNGCDYDYHINGTMDIGPAGCGPVTITPNLSKCKVLLPAQSGLKTITYSNKTEAGQNVVKFSNEIQNIAYEIGKTGRYCPEFETENAKYFDVTNAKATSGGKAVGFEVK